MKHRSFLSRWMPALLLAAASCLSATARRSPDTDKYEFRGAWVQTVFQDRYQRRSTAQNKAYLKQLVQQLHDAGFNAVIFQVRPEADAFYASRREPWSRFLTGVLGLAPKEEWDPLQYMVEVCHEQHMELHAWVNPYRLSASKGRSINDHPIYKEHPDWCVRYGERWYLNPGLPGVRGYVRDVVKDIVTRYDIDAIHFDDYFYPYPEPGLSFDDRVAFATYAESLHIDTARATALADFRRRSVDILIKYVHDDIRQLKPWVRFGVSPFGIYRNKASWSGGSETRGTQCYEDLYADVLKWAEAGWVDYVVPQLYWEIGHQLADYTTLVEWWSRAIPSSCQLYIGQSIERSLDDPKDAHPAPDLRLSHANLSAKVAQARSQKGVDGQCFWYAYQVEDNAWHVADFLRQDLFAQRASTPPFTSMSSRKPAAVRGLDASFSGQALHVVWQPLGEGGSQGGVTYNVYKFAKGEKVSTSDFSHLLVQTASPEFYDQDIEMPGRYTYVVTAVDRYGNEGKETKRKFKLKAAR